MAFWDRFIKKKKRKDANASRNFTGANGGRLFNDWKSSDSSPDAELSGNLEITLLFKDIFSLLSRA